MFDIFDNNWIRITCRDSATIAITLKDSDGEPFEIGEEESVIFTVMTKKEKTVITKVLTIASVDPDDPTIINCELDSNDTDLTTGEYLYDCLFIDSNGQRTTFISSVFQILPAVGER